MLDTLWAMGKVPLALLPSSLGRNGPQSLKHLLSLGSSPRLCLPAYLLLDAEDSPRSDLGRAKAKAGGSMTLARAGAVHFSKH